MRKLIVFNMVSLDGYFVDAAGSLNWARFSRDDDPEFNSFVQENAQGGGELFFGRKTYELMAAHWPTTAARQNDPVVAEGMNSRSKVVFSRTMERATWNNTRLVKDGMVAEVRRMKDAAGPGLAIIGSGEVVAQLTQERLIDEYQFLVIPTVLGSGRTMFEGIRGGLNMRLTRSRAFRNGNVFLCYEPIRG